MQKKKTIQIEAITEEATPGRHHRNRVKRFAQSGMLAALCALSTSSALAEFSVTRGPIWPAEMDYYHGNTRISDSATLNNSGSMIYSSSSLPGNTGTIEQGVYRSGDFYWGIGLLDWGADGATINNTGTIQGIVSGTGEAQGVGILSLQSLTVNNWGLIDGQVRNHDGSADGICAQGTPGLTLYNHAGATISASAPYYADGIDVPNNVHIVNDGTITATAFAGTEQGGGNLYNSAGQAIVAGISTGGGKDGDSAYFENNGTLSVFIPSTTATNFARAQAFTCWFGIPVVWKNTGTVSAQSSSPNGGAETFYYGAQSRPMSMFNSGTISASGVSSTALWMENDGDTGDMHIHNTGTISVSGSNPGFVILTAAWGPPNNIHVWYTNSGTLSGGMVVLGFPTTVYESGQIHTTSYRVGNGSDVHITGLPTIDPVIDGGGSSSTLDFNLTGTLQYINGNPANGATSFSGLQGSSGSIVVSGKTYQWRNFANGVSGVVNPAGSVPAPWRQQDIGAVGVAGGAVYCGGMFTVLGSGNNIGGSADAFRFVHQAASNNCSISAPVTSPRTTNPNGQAGVMIRNGLNANAANAFIGVTATNTVTFQYRSSDGGVTTSTSAVVVGTMHWVKLARSGSALTGYYSVDGTNWTQLGSATINTGATNYMGLAFCNNNNSANGMATFYGATCTGGLLAPSVPVGVTATAGIEQVTLNWQASSNTAGYNIGRSTVNGGPYTTVGSVTTTNHTDRNLAGRTTYYYVVTAVTPGSQSTNSAQVSATPTANVPLPWVAQDLGPVGALGSESHTNGVFTVSGAGADIDNNQSADVGFLDTCRFVYATNSGNCSIVARVASVQNIDPESKGGVMIRSGLNPDAANVVIAMTPGIGVVMSRRSTTGSNGNLVNNVTNLTLPGWVALVQTGSSFSGYYSTNGNDWTLVGTTTVNMTGTEYLGLAVTSRDNNRLCTTTFDNVSAPGWPAAAGPTGLTVTTTPIGTARLTWNALTDATGYNVKRAPASGGPYAVIASNVATTSYTDLAAYSIADCYYVVSAVIGGRETANSAEAVLHHPKLTGVIIGTPGSWGGSGNTIARVFDNNLATYFDAPVGNGAWVGLDLGANASNAVTQINYCPRSGYEGRMVGGVFQGANQPDFSDMVTLGTVTSQPPSGVFTSVGITNPGAFRYVRYLSPDNGYGNVAELQFYGHLAGASLPQPATPNGVAAVGVSDSQINLAWNDATNVTSYTVKRSNTYGGSYTVIATGVMANSFHDTGLTDSTTYFYVVNGVNPGGVSADSVPASAITLPPTPTGLTATAVSATQIVLSWNAVASATSYIVKRSASSGGPYTALASPSDTHYTDTAPAGMKYYYVVSAVAAGQEGSNSAEATVNLPYPWAARDIGSVGLTGGAAFSNGVFTVNGAGGDIQGTADAFQFVYVPTAGDCTIIARVVSVQNTDPWAKAGVMIRQSLDAGAANAFVALTPGNGVTWQYRSSAGGGTGWNQTGGVAAPYWVKLVRSGSTFIGYRSANGTVWTQQGTTTLTMTGTVYVGLALTSHNTSSLCATVFDNVTAPGWTSPMPPSAPVGLTATPGNGKATLEWPASSGATSYNVKRSTTDGGPYTIVGNVATPYYAEIGLVNGTNYYYVASALNPAGESADSVRTVVTPQEDPPSLNISTTGMSPVLSWPADSTGFTLQSRTNLVVGGWQNVALPIPQITNGHWQVTLPPPDGRWPAFYRLAK